MKRNIQEVSISGCFYSVGATGVDLQLGKFPMSPSCVVLLPLHKTGSSLTQEPHISQSQPFPLINTKPCFKGRQTLKVGLDSQDLFVFCLFVCFFAKNYPLKTKSQKNQKSRKSQVCYSFVEGRELHPTYLCLFLLITSLYHPYC